MQSGAMSNNEEVSLAALKSFQESLVVPQDFDGKGEVFLKLDYVILDVIVLSFPVKLEPEEMWSRSWLVYCDIGKKVICQHGAHQNFLTAYVTIFQYLFPALRMR